MARIIIAMKFLLLAACGSSPQLPPEPPAAELARSTHEVATESFNAGRYREAIGLFQEAELRFMSVDDARGTASAALSQAELLLLLGEHDAAEAPMRRAQAASARLSDTKISNRVRLLEARLLLEEDADRAHSLLQDLKGTSVARYAELLQCELAMERGDATCIESLPGGDDLFGARATLLASRAALADNNPDAARAHIDTAIEVFRALAWRPGIAASHELMARVAFESNDHDTARMHLERALYLRLWMEDRARSASLLEQLAATGKDDAVNERYRNWQRALLEGEPDWQEMIQELFTQAPALQSEHPRPQTAQRVQRE